MISYQSNVSNVKPISAATTLQSTGMNASAARNPNSVTQSGTNGPLAASLAAKSLPLRQLSTPQRLNRISLSMMLYVLSALGHSV